MVPNQTVADILFRLRGQAFVIYKDLADAVVAKRELANFPFVGRPLRVQFAKARSHLLEKQDGTFDEEKAAESRKAREAMVAASSKRKPEASAVEGAGAAGEEAKRPKPADFAEKQTAPPNRILFVQNLPAEANELMVRMLFQQFGGFESVSMVPSGGMAFVHFVDIPSANVAMNSLQHFKITNEHLMMISPARSD